MTTEERVETLRAEVTAHKREIAHQRRQLQAKAAELAQLEVECRRRGIGLHIVHPKGVGAIHGRP